MAFLEGIPGKDFRRLQDFIAYKKAHISLRMQA